MRTQYKLNNKTDTPREEQHVFKLFSRDCNTQNLKNHLGLGTHSRKAAKQISQFLSLRSIVFILSIVIVVLVIACVTFLQTCDFYALDDQAKQVFMAYTRINGSLHPN